MAVGIRAAPRGAEGADPALVPVVEVVSERLGAFEVEDRPQLFARDAALEIIDRPHDRKVALGDREELARDAARTFGRERRLERHLKAVVRPDDPVRRTRGLFVHRRDVDREEACGDAALAHPRQVEVTRRR